LIPYILNTLNI